MGDPKKIRKKFSKPRHPWQKARIEEEKVLVIEFGLKNKREIYRTNAMISRIIDHFKILNVQTTPQAQKEKEELLARVKRMGLVAHDKDLTAVLDVKVNDVLSRRLQTIVCKKKLARTVKQARQFITHRHILVNGIVVDAPGYLVTVSDEEAISFIARSPLFSEMHPERAIVEKAGAAAQMSHVSAEANAATATGATLDAAATEDIPAVEIIVDEAEDQ